MLMPEAFGGNRRLYTGSAPAADRRRVDPCPTFARRLPCNLHCILRVGFKNIVFYGVSWPSAATDFILAVLKNRGFYVVLGSREGKKSDKLALYVGLCCPYLGPILAPCWPILALSWPHVGPSWPYVGPRLAYVGPSLAHGGPMLAHLGAYVGASLGVFLAIYVATPSKCQLVRFFPLPRAQNHVKTTVFQHRQDKIRGRRGPRNTVKNDVFEPYTQNTV